MKKQYYCRTCTGLRNHTALFEEKTSGSEDSYFFQWSENFLVIKCLGCETISFLQIYGDTEMVRYSDEGEPEYFDKVIIYPSYLENGNEIKELHYLPEKIRKIYSETIIALKGNAYILAAGGFRAVIEALCNQSKIKKDILSKRIDLLHDKGFLSLNESKRLHSIRFLGNDALHEMEVPKRPQLMIILEIVNHLLENLFIQDKRIGNNMDIIIDTYEDFLKLIRNKITKEELNKEMTLNEILGKSKRLLKQSLVKEFENKLNGEIKDGLIDFLIVVKSEDKITYKIEKMPAFSFNS